MGAINSFGNASSQVMKVFITALLLSLPAGIIAAVISPFVAGLQTSLIGSVALGFMIVIGLSFLTFKSVAVLSKRDFVSILIFLFAFATIGTILTAFLPTLPIPFAIITLNSDLFNLMALGLTFIYVLVSANIVRMIGIKI